MWHPPLFATQTRRSKAGCLAMERSGALRLGVHKPGGDGAGLKAAHIPSRFCEVCVKQFMSLDRNLAPSYLLAGHQSYDCLYLLVDYKLIISRILHSSSQY